MIKLPAGLVLPNANRKTHWSVRWREQQEIKRQAMLIIRLMRLNLRPMQCADIIVVIHPGMRTRRFDPANWGDAAKPAIDALTLAGVLPDDSSAYVPRVSYVAGDPMPGWQLELRITELPEIPATR